MRLRQQLLTKNDCYKTNRKITVKGIVVHSTGANNPKVSRYVPGNDEIGYNTGNNHWDKPGMTKCVHAFLGKFADGGIGTVQTLPWNHRGWHVGGNSNNTHIGFEICEDGLTDSNYFKLVYQEAAELCAMLCKEYKLNPLGDGVIICHQEAYQRGLGSNHGDVLHWFPKHGKSMNDFRQDVYKIMNQKEDEEVTYEQWKEFMNQYRKELGAAAAADYAKPYIKECVDAGIMVNAGTPEDPKIDRPGDFLTRQEAAIMQAQALKK